MAKRDASPIFGKIYKDAIEAGKVERASPNGSDFASHVRRAERTLLEAGCPADPPVSTPSWYARRIIYQAVQMQDEYNRGEFEAAIETALVVGMLVRDLAAVQNHGPAVAFHAEQTETLSTANTERTNKARKKAASWQAKADEVWKRNPTFSNQRVAELIANGANIDTVRRKIHKPSK
jgi:hypothetical protein